MIETIGLIVFGLLGLIVGGDLFIRGAAGLAERLVVSTLAIGLIVVGFGTSLPELITCVEAVLLDQPGLAVGNVIGSNTANVLLILGTSAIIAPIRIDIRALRRDCFALAIATAAGTLVLVTQALSRPLAALFLVTLVGYAIHAYRSERNGAEDGGGPLPEGAIQVAQESSGSLARVLLMALGGLGLVLLGATALVNGAVELATFLGVSDAVIGLTVVAVGTSLPELVTAIIAALRKKPGLAFGNVLGSNVFNVLGILGVTAMVRPLHFPARFGWIDAALFIGSASLMILLSRNLSRVAGVAFVSAWIGYAAWLFGAFAV